MSISDLFDMIFGDEPRFHKDIVHHTSGSLAGYKGSETDEHVGPGSYFAAQNEESRYLHSFDSLIILRGFLIFRSGWQSKSFSKRQPMSPESRSVDRSFHYTAGVIVPTGLALPGSPITRQTPGPGYYGKPTSSPLDNVRILSFGNIFSICNFVIASCGGQIRKHRPSSAESVATWEILRG